MTAAKRLTKDQLFRLSQQGPWDRKDSTYDAVNITSERKRRHRKQKGEVVQHADGSWWLRYFVDNISGTRVKISERLKVNNDADKFARDDARQRRMVEVNKVGPALTIRADDVTLGSFFEFTYLPWLKKNQPYSSWRGVERRWQLYMQPIAKKNLRQFETIDASEFLTTLAEKPLWESGGHKHKRRKLSGVKGLGESTHRQCRNLLSAIFRHAINTRGSGWEGRTNPIREAKTMANVRKAVERVPYTAEEIIAILDAIKRTDGKLMFALCSCMGMRPSEAAALKWSDFGDTHVSIKRSAANGHLREDTKTEKSKADVLLIEPVRTLFAQLKAERKKDEPEDFIFQKPGGLAVNHNSFAHRHITEFAKKACQRYCGLYNGRHSTGSELKRLTNGNSLATADVLRNTVATAEKAYIHSTTADGDAGLVLWQAKLAQVAADRIKNR
jgi:integrase